MMDANSARVTLRSGRHVTYEQLVVCPGIQLDWNRVPGLAEAMKTPAAASHYEFDLAKKASLLLRDLEETTFAECTPEETRDFKALLRIYFAQDGDLRRCAEVLYLHRNTVQYRLDRIRDKTGYDFRKPRDAFLLYLASQNDGNER